MLKSLKLKLFGINDSVKDVKDLNSAQASDITFFHSKKYSEIAKTTKVFVLYYFTKSKNFLPKTCKVIISDKILFHIAQLTKFLSDSVTDFDNTVKNIDETNFKDKVEYGKMFY